MGRIIQKSNSHGSLKDLQILINQKEDLLDTKISNLLEEKVDILWVSPLKADQYSEYRDDDFLSKLGLTKQINKKLNEFWPKRGPQWDALGKCKDKYFLVEAKANFKEFKTTPSKAREQSKKQIMKSFKEVKNYLHITNTVDWTGYYYQYTNRIAHLYYLRVLNKIDAYLINVYFLNDSTVKGPTTIEEWQESIKKAKQYLGLYPKYKLEKYIIDVFIDVKTEMKLY